MRVSVAGDRIYRAIRKLDAMIASKQEEAPLLAAAQRLVEEHRRLLWELKFSDEIFVGQIMELYGAFDLLETQLEKNEHANMFDSLICGPDEAPPPNPHTRVSRARDSRRRAREEIEPTKQTRGLVVNRN